jgi:hypothetical protein
MNKCLDRVNDRHSWNPGVLSYAMIPGCRANSRVFIFIITSIVYGLNWSTTSDFVFDDLMAYVSVLAYCFSTVSVLAQLLCFLVLSSRTLPCLDYGYENAGFVTIIQIVFWFQIVIGNQAVA